MSPVNRSLMAQRIHTSTLDTNEKNEAVSNVGHARDDEIEILLDVLTLRSSWQLARGVPIDPHVRDFSVPDLRTGALLSGAHLCIWDDGAFYDRWKNLRSAGTRHSSHKSEGKQYHVDGFLVHTALFGKLSPCTWLQLEGHPWPSVGHVIDWIRYRYITGKNYGPYGTSPYTESRCIDVIPLDRC